MLKTENIKNAQYAMYNDTTIFGKHILNKQENHKYNILHNGFI